MPLSVDNVEAPLGVALCRRLCAFVEEVDKRDGRARFGVDHPPHHALTEGEGSENKPAEQESEKFFHDDEDKYMPCLAPHKEGSARQHRANIRKLFSLHAFSLFAKVSSKAFCLPLFSFCELNVCLYKKR